MSIQIFKYDTSIRVLLYTFPGGIVHLLDGDELEKAQSSSII